MYMRTLGAFLIAIVLLSSCGEEIKDILPSMSAEIDGADWVTTVRATVEQNDKFIITGTALSGETLIITIFGNTEGTYELTVLNPQCAVVYKEQVNTQLEGSLGYEGTVNLTEVNSGAKYISGTFEFKIMKEGNTMNVTNGVFSRLKYTTPGS